MFIRRLNAKMLFALGVILMAVCASALAGLRDATWEVNPAAFRYDMSLYFKLADKDYENLEKYEIGAFVDDECRGLAERIDLPDGSSCLHMRIRSNQAEGEAVGFLLRDRESGDPVVLKAQDGAGFTFKSDSRVGMPSAPYVMTRFFNVSVLTEGEGSVDFADGLYAVGSVIELEALPAEGYRFAGWSDGVEEASRSLTVEADLTLTASFVVSVYNVEFILDGVLFHSEEVSFGAPIGLPEVPAKEGYSFSGWSDVPETMPASDLVVTGFYVINSYKLVFKVDGEEVFAEDVPFGEPVVAPEMPEKTGYSFAGWGELPETMPAHDLEMHSTYSVNSYRLSFVLDGEAILSEDVPFGSAILAPEAPAKEGYAFAGWGEVPETMPAEDLEFIGSYDVCVYAVTYRIDGEDVFHAQVSFGESVPEFTPDPKEGHSFSGWNAEIPSVMPARDLEFNGSFVADSFNIVFRIDGEVISSDILPFGAEIIAPEAPAREGHSFSGWTDVPSVMPASDVVVDGAYVINKYKVTFMIAEEEYLTLEFEFGAPIVAPEAPEVEGHSFSGWGDIPATMPAFDLVFGGTYAENFYRISFRIDGVVLFTDDVEYGDPISVPVAPEKEGHTFSGWGDVPATMPAVNLEYDATYNVNTYSVLFTIGDDVIFSGELPYGADVVAPEAPAREGYSFGGWGIVPATMPASDLHISGDYAVNSYTITYRISDEDFFTTQMPFGAEVVAPEAPAKEGHSFSGWVGVPSVMPAADVVVSGAYSPDSYRLSFVIGDEVIFSGDVLYGTEISVPEAPAKEGHTFAGWGMVPATMPAADLVITGWYDVNVYTLTFDIDGEVFYVTQLAYGSDIVAPVEVPDKEGSSFGGWGNVPATMPANDLIVSGTYSVNHYTVTFRIGEEVLFTGEQPYGSEIVVPEVPEREGYSFSGWGDVPSVVPARNLEFVGSFEANVYTLTFKADEEVVFSAEVPYGSEIVAPVVAEKEGHTFSGWGVVAATMPASDLEVTGTYAVNVYAVVFRVGEEVILSAQIPYGSEIVAPEVAEKEGHTFSGWGDVPAVMPASDLEFIGEFTVNTYKAVFMIGEEVIAEIDLAYGADLVIPEAPDMEGHTFTGWGIVPTVMPAADLVFTGSYEVNCYTLTVKLDGEVILSSQLPFGAEIVLADPVLPEGVLFEGWVDEVPATMPAHDVVINGRTMQGSSVSVVGADSLVDVYDLNGVVILRDVKASEASKLLKDGLYIIGGRTVIIR